MGALTLEVIHAETGDSIGGNVVLSGMDEDYAHFIYFSRAALTTVGFGDITPVTPLTRLASLALSVLGPLYIAVVLGVLISRFSGGQEPPPWAP